ncbi:MAG: AAA family ATPase [Bacteroidales bacterium]|nr:AAA family ATPase [Bacteroidales bacterium]
MQTIGITGTIGAGKGTIVAYLVEKYGFKHFSVREFLLDEIRHRKMPENRDSMVTVANELREKHSPSYITDQLYDEAVRSGGNAIIESIRTPGEILSLRKKNGFTLLAVDADAEKRFERIRLRKSETDQIDFETFLENEKREMDSTDPNKQNLRKCIEMADFVIRNNGSVNDLHREVEEILKQLKN